VRLDLHRRFTQGLGALLAHGYLTVIATKAIYQGPLKGVCVPMMACYACPAAIVSCPIGTLQHFAAIGDVPWLLVGVLTVTGALIGRMACGWLCPFGLIQDLIHRIPCPKITIPDWLGNIKYAVLLIPVVLLPAITKVPWFSQLCPAGTLTAGIPWVLWDPIVPASGKPVIVASTGGLFALKVGILVAFLVLFAAAKRPFCRVFCPLGAILSLFGRVSLVRLKVSDSCARCGQCQSRCPVDHAVWKDPNSGECVRCLACTSCRNVTVGLAGVERAVPVCKSATTE
jgi:ferredoxin-type protein NapH